MRSENLTKCKRCGEEVARYEKVMILDHDVYCGECIKDMITYTDDVFPEEVDFINHRFREEGY
jgi:hypothetical protein